MGADFPTFLAQQPQLLKMGYLPDCARLDLPARSYTQPTVRPIDLETFQQLTPEEMMKHRLIPPCDGFCCGQVWPLFRYLAASTCRADAPKPQSRPKGVLSPAPSFDPAPHSVPPAAALVRRNCRSAQLDQAH